MLDGSKEKWLLICSTGSCCQVKRIGYLEMENKRRRQCWNEYVEWRFLYASIENESIQRKSKAKMRFGISLKKKEGKSYLGFNLSNIRFHGQLKPVLSTFKRKIIDKKTRIKKLAPEPPPLSLGEEGHCNHGPTVCCAVRGHLHIEQAEEQATCEQGLWAHRTHGKCTFIHQYCRHNCKELRPEVD